MADWAGEFGNAYTDRNTEIKSRHRFWDNVAPDIDCAIEIGCNIGTNLEALKKVRGVSPIGVEINPKAAAIAREKGFVVYTGNAIQYMPGITADMVFTVGVLIHLRTPDLIKMMRVLRSHSHKYVFFGEYHCEYDREIAYHGVPGSLYARPFGDIYRALFPEDVLLRTGEAGPEQGFDNITWWLYDRSDSPGEN